jgi:hypothetical protein
MQSIGTELVNIAFFSPEIANVYLLLLKAARVPELVDFIGPVSRRVPDLGRLVRK